ncbi:hypothetical protein [Pedobacter deserti]|uniref:hypothetical protein n=1 Tax=Pedobacter deserti TaxID=2817382 RepID=UPI00210AD972|nr:hypothetical protein [Pedobacter sp. SYSU D00382]
MIFKPSTTGFVGLLLLFAVSLSGYAQADKPSDLHLFMQKHADTTIIIEYRGGWMTPHCQMISKKGDTITAYTYQTYNSPLYGVLMPTAIREKLIEVHDLRSERWGDVNRMLDVKKVSTEALRRAWTALVAEKPWDVRDDTMDGVGCPRDAERRIRRISDGSAYDLILISKSGIEKRSFDSPEEYENLCPGRKGRQSMLKILRTFGEAFRK